MHRKPLGCILAGILAVSVCGCGSSGQTITQDELPYGATIESHKEDGILPSQYDFRFVTADMRDTVLRYYYAIQTKDTALFESVQHPLWRDYELNTVYSGQFTDEQLLSAAYDQLALKMTDDFEFSFIDITDAEKCEEGSDGMRIVEVLDALAKDKGESDFSVQAMWKLTVTRFLAKKGSGVRGETSVVLEDEMLYLMQCQNDWYLIYT